jgi:hypothetical protein
MKFILHNANLDSLQMMARAAQYAAQKELKEGEFGLLSYYSGDTEVGRISYIKRKDCITLYDQPIPQRSFADEV